MTYNGLVISEKNDNIKQNSVKYICYNSFTAAEEKVLESKSEERLFVQF